MLESRKPYNLLSWNCQHFTSLAATGEKESPDLQSWGSAVTLLFGGFFLYGLLNQKKSA
jgi:hypothetical protein